MGRIVRLNEQQISRIVKKVLLENERGLLKEAKGSIDRNTLVTTYDYYNNKGSDGTFKEIFKPEIDAGKQPFVTFTNGCATKVSLALAKSGQEVDAAFRTTSGTQKGTPIQTSANGLKNNLIKKWGQPDVKFSGSISESDLLKKIGTGKTGILICTPCGFSGASGHATVWSRIFGTKKTGGTRDNTTYHLDNPEANIYYWYV